MASGKASGGKPRIELSDKLEATFGAQTRVRSPKAKLAWRRGESHGFRVRLVEQRCSPPQVASLNQNRSSLYSKDTRYSVSARSRWLHGAASCSKVPF